MDYYEYSYCYNSDVEYLNTEMDEPYETSWRIISKKVLQILRGTVRQRLTYEPMYIRIRRCMSRGKSQDMYQDLLALCAEHVKDIKHEIGQTISSDDRTLDHLVVVGGHTRDYLNSIKNIEQIFAHLNKNYIAEQLKKSLFSELAELYNNMILNHRIPILMRIAEDVLKPPNSVLPSTMHRIFNDLHIITEGKYSMQYMHLFSRYCVNVLPRMKESDLEAHIAEVKQFQETYVFSNIPQGNQGLKRRADEC